MLVGLRKRLHAPFWGPGHGDWVSSGGIEPSTREQASIGPLVCCLLQAYLVEQNKGLTAGC